MIENLAKAAGQLSDRRVSAVVLWSLLLTIVLYAAVWGVAVWLLDDIEPTSWGWVNTIIEWASVAGVFVLSLFLFSAFVSLISSFFVERVVSAVEERHFPQLPAARDTSLLSDVEVSIKFTLLTLVVNMIALPFYIVFLFFPILSAALFYIVNGFLFGREYYDLVSFRRLEKAEAKSLRRGNRGRLFVAGVIIAALSTIPVVNLLVPVLASAFMTHVFHGLPSTAGAR